MSAITMRDAYGFLNAEQIQNRSEPLVEMIGKRIIRQKLAEECGKLALLMKVEHIVSYIPIISTIVAIVKLVLLAHCDRLLDEATKECRNEMSRKNLSEEQLAKAGQSIDYIGSVKELTQGYRIRSVIELFSLGLVLVIPDLIVTVLRSSEKLKLREAVPDGTQEPRVLSDEK